MQIDLTQIRHREDIMMSPRRENERDRETAIRLIKMVAQKTRAEWPKLYGDLRRIYKHKFIVRDPTIARYDLFLAVLALEMQALDKYSAMQRAQRIREAVLKSTGSSNHGKYAREEIETYENLLDRIADSGRDPLETICSRLLHRWLGYRIKLFEICTNGRDTRVIDPPLVAHIKGELATFIRSLEKLKDNEQ
jgi:hypothetical protein